MLSLELRWHHGLSGLAHYMRCTDRSFAEPRRAGGSDLAGVCAVAVAGSICIASSGHDT